VTLFTGLRPGEIQALARDEVVSQRDIPGAFHRTITRAEVGRLRFHDCRHIFASLLITAGKTSST